MELTNTDKKRGYYNPVNIYTKNKAQNTRTFLSLMIIIIKSLIYVS